MIKLSSRTIERGKVRYQVAVKERKKPMLGEKDIWMILRQRRDQRDDPAWQHLATIRAAQQARRARFYNWMLARLGQRLSTWGDWLQEHYGNSCSMQLGASQFGASSIGGDSIREG
jgi:hypothetical protein